MRKEYQRELSGKAQRYEQATQKYKLFQTKKDKLSQMDSILTGKQKDVLVPKPGEFFVVNTSETPSYSKKLIQTASFNNIADTQLIKNDENKTISQFGDTLSRGDGRFKFTNQRKDQPGVTMTSLKGQLERQMSHTEFSKKEGPPTVHFDRNIGLLDMQTSLDERFKDTIKYKQDQLLANPQMRTSLTTNIKNIMGSQDKAMLTASSRLLHAEVRFQGLELQSSPKQSKEHKATTKSFSTLDLLKQVKNKSRYELAGRSNQAMSHVCLPPLNDELLQSSVLDTKQDLSSPNKSLNRPTSTLVMQVGDEDQALLVKDKFDIQNARNRDKVSPSTHSYQVKSQHPMLISKKWKDNTGKFIKPGTTSTIYARIKQPPVIVQYQQALINENIGLSPFLEDKGAVSHIINDTQRNLMPSQSVKVMPTTTMESIKKEKFSVQTVVSKETEQTMKYSNSIQTLKNLQGTKQEASVRYLKKGTSKYLKNLMDRQKQNAQIYIKSPVRSHIQQLNQDSDVEEPKMFLPVEAFDPLLDSEDPIRLIEQYRNPATGQTMAISKWNYPNGEAELRKCIVNDYIKKSDLYEIIWVQNTNIKKRVSRFNLIFDLEDKALFEQRLSEAHKMREQAEILMKYHFQIDKTELPKSRPGRFGQQVILGPPTLIDVVKTRISYLIASFKPYEQVIKLMTYKNPLEFFSRSPSQKYEILFFVRWQQFSGLQSQEIVDQVLTDMTKRGMNITLLGTLFNELNEDFIRLHKRIWFDLQLPFNKDLYKTFRDVLPAEKFVPIQDRIIDETDQIAIVQIKERAFQFHDLLQQMTGKLHQSNKLKLDVLNMAQRMKCNIQPMKLLHFQFTQPISRDDLINKHKIASFEVIKALQDCIFDCEYEVIKIINLKQIEVDKINFDRKREVTHKAEDFVELQIPQEYVDDLKKFQRVLQYSFEHSMRDVFISTVDTAKEQLKFAVREIEEVTGKQFSHDEDEFSLTDIKDVPQIDLTANQQNIKTPPQLNQSHELCLNDQDLIKMSRDAYLQERFLRAQCFQFQVSLVFNTAQKEIQISPSPAEWVGNIIQLLENSLDSLKAIKCILYRQLQPVHQNECSQVFLPDDPYPNNQIQSIAHLFKQLFQVPQSLAKEVCAFQWILSEDIKLFKKKQKHPDMTVEMYNETLNGFKRQRNEIEILMFQPQLMMGPFVVEVGQLRKKLLKKLDELTNTLFECLTAKVMFQSKSLEQEVEKILEVVQKKSFENIEEVDQTRKFVLKIQEKFDMLRVIVRDINKKTDFLDANCSRMSEEQIRAMWESFGKPAEILYFQSDCLERLDQFTLKYADELKIMQEDHSKMIIQITLDFDEITNYEDLANYEQIYKKCEETDNKLYDAQRIAEICNRREVLFGQSKSDFSSIRKLQENFNPHLELWTLAKDYFRNKSQWMKGPIADLDGDQLPRDIIDASKKLIKLQKVAFKDALYTKEICNQLKTLYHEFRPYLPIITALKNIDFKQRHFDILKKVKEPPFEIEHDLSQSLADLERMGVMEIIDEISEISEIATKERLLESQVNKMRDEWKSVKFTIIQFRDSQSGILQGVQPVWDLLDEQIQKTMLIASSPYAKFFIQDVLYWKSNLVKVQEILEEWSKTQRGWCYLWPIFNSPDIQAQLPDVALLFQSVDQKWKVIMEQTEQSPLVLECANQYKVYENFVGCNETIDKVTKSLNEYLHQKQLKFARFFFLSNDDLLHILSQTKEPIRVQDHLNKCFEGISKLEFEAQTDIIKGMYSAMGEYIQFDKPVEPWIAQITPQNAKKPIKGQSQECREVRPIEIWLLEVEEQMRNCLRTSIIQGMLSQAKMSKQDWIFAYPQQTILVLDQILWTQSVEKAINLKSQDSLIKAHKAEERKLQELVSLIQKPRSSKIQIQTLETLIVTDVHSMDVTQTIMEQKVNSVSQFEWISQLRHYKVMEEQKGQQRLELKISMINSTRFYGFEYQGNQTRLVITPLTDRCYRTLMGALQLNLGGAPEGPAGTGKTETTKDLAKALAKQCLVFNCSDQLDVQTMGKFFTGLACCGAWACFDEFNRIDLEVLSVIASQILQIQTALMRRQPNAPFQFEDEKILLNAQCAVFITMNPGYAGRSELPDNLKALFRPVAMMIPNYELIAEISLYSYGFQTARDLSVKIVQSLRLSSEQLSTQSHYDYGMRAVKSIILAAGVLKRKYADMEESKLVLRAITDCNVPKFINEDINLFGGIIQDLFPTTDKRKEQYGDLEKMIALSINSSNLQLNVEFQTKTIQLYETVQVRHGLMLVGGAMGGKTQITNTLADALSRISKQNFLSDKQDYEDFNSLVKQTNQKLGCPQVRVHRMNPKSVSIGQLYGDFEKVTRDWHDGILATTVKNAVNDKVGDTHWIMLDGPVDAVWIENLNTVLDDNKKLCLISGEIVKLTDDMKMMFEVEDLLEASPATVSRCGMVYISPEKLGWQVLLLSWINQLPDDLKQFGVQEMYVEMVDTILPEVIDFLFGKNQSSEEDLRLQSLKPIVTTSKIWQFRSFLNLFESLLLNGETKASLRNKKKEAEETARIKAKVDLKVKNSAVSNQISDDSEAEQENEGRKHIQPYFDVVEPSQLNHIIQAFVMALIWGFGAPLLITARDNYSQFIQKILRTKFLESCDFKFKKRVKLESFPSQEQNLFNVFYNLDLKMWLKWDHDIEKYDICGDIAADSKPSANQSSDDSDGKVTSPRSTARLDMDDLTKIEYSNLNIVTQDTLKHIYLLEKLTTHDFPIVMLGATGTGKTQVIKKFLSRLTQQKGKWEIGEMVLSATTTANQVQEYTFSRLEKHKKGVYGPKNPNACLIIFIDDLNMPAKEKYGAQPSLEMMRQIIDTGGFYRGKENQFLSVIKQMFICAMGLPGGGRSLPTMRLLRHFNLLHVPELSQPIMKRIFTKILEWGLEKHHQTWKKSISTITDLTIECYQRAVKWLLPTPAKSHYLFNLRQVSEIIQGVLFLDVTTVEKQQDKIGSLKRLWVHECMRVFSDRLISDDDKKMFIQKCLDEQNSTFIDLSKMPDPESIIFNNFVKFDPNNDLVYEESSSMSKIKSSLENILGLYNDSKSPKDRMDLLFFEYMIHHLSRTSRIIMKPQGNGLLIGLSGNGRQSVAKLAIYINDSSQFSIEIHKNYGIPEWQEDLRNLFKTLGIDNKKTVFTFSDKDIKNEVFFEDIDSILNVGELTSLFDAEDLEEIQYEVEKQVKKSRVKLTPMDIFKRRCKKNLHLLLFMSPAGNGLQLYFRKYPSLVNCTSIDWYLAWPDQALLAVSEQYLRQAREVIQESQIFDDQTLQTKKKLHLDVITENDEKDDRSDIGGSRSGKHSERPSGTPQEIVFEINQDPDFQRIKSMHVNERVSVIMTKIHQEAILLAEEFQAKKRKHVYVTPLMFANMFKIFKNLLERKIKAMEQEMSKYQQGITKLEEAKVMIDDMQIQLERLKPVLEQKKKQVDATMKRLEKESKMVEAKREIVDKEAYQVKLQRDDADAIKAECKERLDIAEPYFQQAIAALKCLNASEFQVIKSFTSPPRGVKLALEACCIMLGLKGKIVKDANNQKTVDFWEVSKKMITNYKKLIDQMENYPKEDVNPTIIQKIQPYLANPEFAPEQIKKASEAAEGICKWVQAICKFDIVYKEITPKRIALAAANEKLKLVSQQLAEKQAELQLIIEQKMQLELEFKEQNQEKEDLIHQRDEAQKKLNRANQLISSIGSEKDRWINTRAKLAEDKRSLLGDMIMAAAIITYLGPFDGKFRTKALNERWIKVISKYQIDQTANFSLKEVIANEEKVTDWLIKGLPNERVSIENMIIITECKVNQFPVLIDPQGQAFKFLRQYNHQENFIQLKLTQPNATSLLTHALQDGSVVLVENAAEVTSPSLISILRRELSSSVGNSQLIKFNDNQVEFDQNFFCYICSQYSNPHLSPEVHQLAKVLDFSVTREGLEQQLLQIVCKSESAKEEDEREKLSKQGLLFTQQKKQIVNDILDTLRNSGKNILESDDLVNKLEASKQLTNEINHKLNVARHVEDRIEENRKLFKPVAEHGARLYFAVQDLPLLDPMYQFSMKWFKDLFNSCFDSYEEEGKDEEDGSFIEHDSTPDSKPKRQRVSTKLSRNDREPVKTKEQKIQRVLQLKTKFREVLYKNVCMSLFETHKLLFAFFMSLKIFETGELKEQSFGEKLKALDKQAEDSQLSKFESSSKQSDDTMKKVLGGRGSHVAPQSRKSMSIRGNDEMNKIFQKEDDRLKINEELLNYTLTGLLPIGMQIYANDPNPDSTVFSADMWKDLETLTAFDCFETLLEEITKNLPAWTRFMKADKESLFDQLPEPYQSQLSYFAWIPLIRVLQPDMTTGAIRRYVIKSIGSYFVQPIIYQISEIYNESKVYTPMLLLLTPGNDPMEAIRKAAEEKGKVPYPISLGKGQGEKAKKLIQESKKYDSWIVLQNCHLAASFLPDLEQIIENIQPQTGKVQIQDQQYNKKEKEELPPHPGFRIWLTSMSIDNFPQSILHSSIKITSEPPKGIKASMLRQYAMINGNKTEKTNFEAHPYPEKWQPLFLALSFFHAVVRERKRFGPLGWTKLYDFNDSDFRISMRQLYIMVEEFDDVPFAALQYLTGDCNYGGRVTDDRDRIALAAILKDFYTENTYLKDEYYFAGENQKKYRIFRAQGIKDYLEYVKQLPDEESPELMGLHENANITQAIYEASQIFQNVIKLSTSSKQEVKDSSQDQCRTMVTEILQKIRDPFKIKEVEAMYPFSYEESMNSVLLQELARYNKLIEVVKGSLNTLLKTLEGKFVTTSDIEALKASILSNSIPEKWQKVSYQSRKPLLSYIQDLQLRLQMLEKWIRNGKPNVFWISGFFFTQSFLTGVKQNFARSFKYPIDQIDFKFEILKYSDDERAHQQPPQFGCFLQGLFLEGASWNDLSGCLMESKRGEMHILMPIINFVPVLLESVSEGQQEHTLSYACPTYKTGERYGTLLTTGHSTNYVMNILLPSEHPPEHWVKRSVALLTQLDI